MNILITIARELNKNRGFRKNWRRWVNDKLSIVYGKQDLHSFMNQYRPEGLTDQENIGTRLKFVSISE